MTARVRRECNQLIEAMGGVAQAKWQQPPTQREESSRAQEGNNNRVKNAKKPRIAGMPDKGERLTLKERRERDSYAVGEGDMPWADAG